jgi:hypothetical protein
LKPVLLILSSKGVLENWARGQNRLFMNKSTALVFPSEYQKSTRRAKERLRKLRISEDQRKFVNSGGSEKIASLYYESI